LRLQLALRIDEQRAAVPDDGAAPWRARDEPFIHQFPEGQTDGVAAHPMVFHELRLGRQLRSGAEYAGVDGPSQFRSHLLIQHRPCHFHPFCSNNLDDLVLAGHLPLDRTALSASSSIRWYKSIERPVRG